MSDVSTDTTQRLVGLTLDENSLGRGTPDQEHERAVAIYDLIERNSFVVPEHEGGPYLAHLAMVERRLVFEIKQADGAPVVTHHLSLSPFRRIIKDYELVCDSYYAAIRTSTPTQIEAIDMGRRGIHNDGSQTLMDRLSGKIKFDFDTARRLFTLVCVLYWRG